ncbi:MAG: hypothetical protein ACQGTM_16830 [bacterium]
MSSELVFYILTAAEKPVAAVSMRYDCKTAVYGKCALLSVVFEDGHTVEGCGCTIFGALHALMEESGKHPGYFGIWKNLD